MDNRIVTRRRLLRRDDLLVLDFEFVNFRLMIDEMGTPRLIADDPDAQNYIIVYFPPQHIAEEALIEEETHVNAPAPDVNIENLGQPPDDPPPDPNNLPPQPDPNLREPPIMAQLSGRSRLVFTLRDGVDSIPYTVEGLLDWTQFEPSLARTALPPDYTTADITPRPKIEPPATTETAIEFPSRLFISPNRTAGWAHAVAPVTHNGRTELWHTRLGVRKEIDELTFEVDEDDASTRTIRAIWSPDYKPPAGPDFGQVIDFITSLRPSHRHQLVRLTADYGIASGFLLPDIEEPGNFANVTVDLLRRSNRPRFFGYGRPIIDNIRVPDFNDEARAAIESGDLSRVSAGVIDAILSGYYADIPEEIIGSLIPLLTYYRPVPVEVRQLMLTSQGAWANLEGKWGRDVLPIPVREPLGLSLVEWEHQATQGRDQYVRTLDLGYCSPYRNLLVKLTITERKFQTAPVSGDIVAYLRQRIYIIVLEPEIAYENASFPHNGREMPFKGLIRFKTLITPRVDTVQGKPSENIGYPTSGAHWVKVGGELFHFKMEAEDADGNLFPFTSPVIFVPLTVFASNNANKDTLLNQDLPAAYMTDPVNPDDLPMRTCFVPVKRVAYAPKVPGGPGNSELETENFVLDVVPMVTPPSPGLPHVPVLKTAAVRMEAADQVTGSQGAQRIKLFQQYLDSADGLLDAANEGRVFAELVNLKALPFTAEQAGGLSTPNMALTGISQELGPVAGTLSNIANGNFDPVDFFQGMDPKLFGGISLMDIILSIADGATNFRDQIPKLLSERIPATPELPEHIEAAMKWEPDVKTFLPFETRTNPDTDFIVDIKLRQYLATPTAPPALEVKGSLTEFNINFAGIIIIYFKEMTFLKEENKKLDVHVNIPDDGITFDGPLKFLQELQPYLDPASFADPPVLEITPSGVTVGYTLELPPLAVGAFTLKNVALGAALFLPFGGGPSDRMRVRFNLSERYDPFQLAVMIFAGGGFFAISLGADGMEVLEIALEFGAAFELNIGVASGGVSAMAGIYFRIDVVADELQFDAYLRINGHLSVLGIITISIEFYMVLSYKEEGDRSKLLGRATVTVKVEVLFFSATVSMTVERKFSGSADDPTFSDMLTPGDWFEYGEAFA